jgi:hypothetical protein
LHHAGVLPITWARKCRRPGRTGGALKLLLLVLIGCLLVVTAGLFALTVRRDEPILGLAGLTAAMGAAFVALPYSALEDF